MAEYYNPSDDIETKRKFDITDSRYSINNFKYPEDVNVAQDLKNTVVFFINVRGRSKYKTNDNTLYEIKEEQPLTKEGVAKSVGLASAAAQAGIAYNSLSLSATARKIMGGAPVGKTIGEQLLKGTDAAVKTGVASTAIAGALASFEQSTTHRLKDAITLAIQEMPKTSYSVKYEDFDVGTLMGGMSSSSAGMGSMLAAGILKTAQIPTIMGAPEFGRGIQKMAGESINPFKTVLFKEVELRTFKFDYRFMPKSKKEAMNVMNIIRTFKYHMHPEFSTDNVFLLHPSEFNIAFYFNGKENPNWNKIGTCVLMDMHLDAGAEQLATFEDGMSVEINMSLIFKETEMLTKEKVIKGY